MERMDGKEWGMPFTAGYEKSRQRLREADVISLISGLGFPREHIIPFIRLFLLR